MSAFSGPSQRVQKSGSVNELSLFRQRLSFLRLLPHILQFAEPVCTFHGAHVRRGLWESSSGRVRQEHLTILANVILEARARAALSQPQPGWYREWTLEQPQALAAPHGSSPSLSLPARPEALGAQIPRGAAAGVGDIKPGGGSGGPYHSAT